MSNITLTLSVTITEAQLLLNTLSESRTSSSANDLKLKASLLHEALKPSHEAPKDLLKTVPGKKVTMPSFGRTPEQIASFSASEADRLAKSSTPEEEPEEVIPEPREVPPSPMPESPWALRK